MFCSVWVFRLHVNVANVKEGQSESVVEREGGRDHVMKNFIMQ